MQTPSSTDFRSFFQSPLTPCVIVLTSLEIFIGACSCLRLEEIQSPFGFPPRTLFLSDATAFLFLSENDRPPQNALLRSLLTSLLNIPLYNFQYEALSSGMCRDGLLYLEGFVFSLLPLVKEFPQPTF